MKEYDDKYVKGVCICIGFIFTCMHNSKIFIINMS